MKLRLLTRKRRPAPSLVERREESFFSPPRANNGVRLYKFSNLNQAGVARAPGKRPLPGRVVYQRGHIMHLTRDPVRPLVRIISPLWTIDRR